MDFVVVGFGLGALGVLLGVVMLGWLAPRAQRAAARSAAPDAAAHDLAIAAEHRRMGQAFLYAGAAMLLATVGGLAGALDDRTGALLVATTATVAAAGIVLGGYLHHVRNPAPRRRRPSPARETALPAAAPLPSASLVLADAASGAADPSQVFPDIGDAGEDPVSAPGEIETGVAGNGTANQGTNDGSALGDIELDRVATATSSDPESGRTLDPAGSRQSDDAVPAEEEDVVVVGLVVPTARPADSPSPPSGRDEGDDPS